MKNEAKRLIIAVDVDDVLVPTNEAMRVFINERFGTNHTEDDYNIDAEYKGYWDKVWGVDDKESEHRYKTFIESGVLLESEPLVGAIEVIAELETRYELVILSARRDDQVQMTHDWLLKHFPAVFSDVRFISGWYHGRKVSKAEVCIEIGASYLIDDNVEHCITAHNEGITALLFGEHGWNKNNPHEKELVRTRDWSAVKEYFDGQPS